MAARPVWLLGQRITIIPGSDHYALCDISMPADIPGPPPHIHHDCSEHFYVIEGSMEVMLGGEWRRLEQGDDTCVPRGALHTFRNAGHNSLRVLVVLSPAGFEQFFREIGIPDETPDAYRRSMEQAVLDRVVGEAARFQMEFRLAT